MLATGVGGLWVRDSRSGRRCCAAHAGTEGVNLFSGERFREWASARGESLSQGGEAEVLEIRVFPSQRIYGYLTSGAEESGAAGGGELGGHGRLSETGGFAGFVYEPDRTERTGPARSLRRKNQTEELPGGRG